MIRDRSILLFTVGLASVSPSFAEPFTWQGGGCYTCPESWTPEGVPDSTGDVAEFGTTGVNAVTVNAPVNPSSWVFASRSQDYAIAGLPVSFDGPGLINNASELIVIFAASWIGKDVVGSLR